MSMESEIIQNPFYHYTYVFDKNTGNLEYPDVYLLSKGLHKLGQLYPINDLNIVVKANDTDEISFIFQKYVNDTEQELYNKVKTDSVVYIKGFGCYQLKVNENDKGEGVYKSVSGESLADVELSNILATLEINTEQDILVSDYENENVTDYIPTVFFRDESKYDDYIWSTGNSKLSDDEKKQKLKDSSLLHRIFSYAPHYEIGHVDESLYYVQRDFSWSNSYIKDILNDVAEEVGCIFTFETYLDDNGKTVRKVNAYDISYCEKCFKDAAVQLSYKTFDTSVFRSITNGVCDNCGSSEYVYDYGKDTDIFITTENLTDEISVQPDNEIKNVFKISGGDDNITSAIQALNMGSSKIMMFSEETKNEMSDELRKKFEDYINDQSSIETSYETLVETQSNVYDLIQYLQSGKMPQLADNARDIQEEVKYLLNSITEDYENNFYVESYDKGEKSFLGHKETVSSSSIKNLFTLYLDKGYSVRVSNGDIGDKTNPNDSYVRWDGIITIYETSNSDNYADIHCSKSDTTYVVYNQITAQNSDSKLQETYDSFYVNLMFADQDSVKYASYIQQFCEQKLASYKKIEYKNEEEKPWNEYCYERLKSFYDGYQACLEVLSEMDSQQTIQSVKQVISDIYNNYSFIQYKISQQMKILVQQINALYRYLGEYTYDTDKYGKRTYSPDYVSENYVVDYKKALSYLANPSMTKYFIGTKPIACKKCGSSNVGIAKNDSGKEYNYCLSCGNTDSSLLVTYADIAKQVSEQCNKSERNLLKDITEIRNKFKIENYFGELYSELLPYIKEQEYSNSNYTSDACNTNQDIIAKAKELLQKARKELYKACEQQYSVSADVFSIVAERWKNWDTNTKYYDMYDKFSLGNWMRVRLDKTIKKLRLISITFDFDTVDKMSVEFSDVIQVGNVLSDINSVLQQASSISSTYNYVTDQAKQGSEANVEINKILQNGLDSAYSAVMAGDNQEITMDRHGLLFRKFLDELDDYSKYQMKMINRNIVMTDNGWESARLAIGLGMLPDGTYGYGIWADNIIGGKVNVTENLTIGNSSKSVEITSDGIVLDGGAITWKNPLADGSVPQSSVSGLPDTLKSLSKDIEQLDGRIQTYSQSDDPSTSWNEDEKSKHKGDIWFNPSDGLTKRWDGTKWDVVTDSSLVALAQSKGQIFTTQPTPPYNVGDLWIGNNKSDLLRCQTPKKLDEKFDIKDWIVGVKYTDDTELKNFIKGDYAEALQNINTQIDSKADTFYQSTKPHEEYTNVADNNTYNLYVGDLWYDTTTGKSYMYTKTANGSNYNYTWKFMDVPNDVYDTIDGIASIYVTLPSNPNVGDLLIPNSDIESGTKTYYAKKVYKYDGTNWTEINYTDDTAWKTWTSDAGDFGKYKKDIQTQLDGKSNCTYGGSTPPSNPETGDLWFCTNNSGGYGANKDYMYNGSSWVESNGVPDSVWDIADGKSSIFVVKPEKALSTIDSNFYHKNDIWILESDMTLNGESYKKGSIMTSTSDSTRFVESHWIEKVRYTDDTMAEKALSELDDIGKDGVITPTEKQQIKLIINDISSTKSSIEKQCEAYNIKEEDVPLYKTYLDTYSSLISMVNTLLSDMSKTSSTPSNYNSLFSSYYIALENMTSVIEEASKKYASDVASGIKTDLQEQIDGKIETFYQDTVPTWNASENSKHIGDLWYNTSSTDITHNSKTYSAKTNYRFNGTSWEENSIIPKDFYDAVDGKSTVYSSIPTTPQDRDLLIPGADITIESVTYKKGKVYRYKSSDGTWNEINYTDDSALQEMLTSISADDELSVAEKSYIKKQMNEIAKEYDSIKARAERYSIWSTLTSYQTAYTNLNNYISPLLSKMDEVSSITKSTFD